MMLQALSYVREMSGFVGLETSKTMEWTFRG